MIVWRSLFNRPFVALFGIFHIYTGSLENSTFNYHDAVKIAFSTKEKFPADSIQIFWNGEKTATTGAGKTEYDYRIPATKTGRNTLKLVAFHPDNKRSVAHLTVIVKPNRAPPVR